MKKDSSPKMLQKGIIIREIITIRRKDQDQGLIAIQRSIVQTRRKLRIEERIREYKVGEMIGINGKIKVEMIK